MDDDDSQALALLWAFGISSDVREGVVSLRGDAIAYVAAHTTVIYSRAQHTQMVLQGHCNQITCICATADRRMLATADEGEGSMIVLWDTATGQPLRTLATGNGCVGADLSPDGSYLIALSSAQGGEQEVSLWNLSDMSTSEPCCVATVPPGDVQTCVRFPPSDPGAPAECVSNGKQRTYFWRPAFQAGSFKYYSPPISARDFKQALGDFTVSCFVPRCNRCLTGTADGDVVVWEEGRLREAGARPTDRRASKILRIHHAAVNTLSCCGRYVVSGGADGFVRFFDSRLRLSAWFENLEAGPVGAVSFSTAPVGLGSPDEDEESGADGAFSAPDFVVGTSYAKVVAVSASTFDDPRPTAPRGGTLLLEGMRGGATALASHPQRPEFVVVGGAGLVQVWDHARRTLVASRYLERLSGSAIAYNPAGDRIAVGSASGHLKLLRSTPPLSDAQSFRFTTSSICRLAFCSDGLHLASADDSFNVALLSYGHGRQGDRWELVGKCVSHTSSITGLAFAPSSGGHLYSVGSEGNLVTYNLQASDPQRGLHVDSHGPVSHGAAPTALCIVPPDAKDGPGAESLVVLSDAALKLRVCSASSRECRSTALGPAYGGALSYLELLPSSGSGPHILAYAAADRAAGLCTWPVTGDPAGCIGLIAHPGPIAACYSAASGRKLLTCGADGVVNVWAVDSAALVAATTTPGAESREIEAMLEGGRDGAVYAEARDYFYYAQLKAQGEAAVAPRAVSGKVPLEELPGLMCALGHYPTEAEVADSLAECEADMSKDEGVMLSRLLKVYAHHRPVQGVTKADITEAFAALGADPTTGQLTREELVRLLGQYGECMQPDELEGCLGALYGAPSIEDGMPESMNASEFAEEVLGFEDYVN